MSYFWKMSAALLLVSAFYSNALAEKLNRLAKETSPYLLQHRANPVNWYPWGGEALKAARTENKPIFLSIGYSSCYWCHVMEKETFEDPEAAAVLNKYFINIKLDREERPDIDAIYMDSVQAMTGRGGWPMSVFLTPERKPFFGGTYFPKKKFIEIAEAVGETWIKSPNKAKEASTSLMKLLRSRYAGGSVGTLSKDIFAKANKSLESSFDAIFGGFGGAPKFPQSGLINLLLRIHKRSKSDESLRMIKKTLIEMAKGGMYDHVGGGFHRYSTDKKWLVPHFEKMLYDNALLSRTYLDAYSLTGEPYFKYVAIDTLRYVLREMKNPQGAFYSTQDAGEVGAEGEFYVWKYSELESLVSSEELAFLTTHFDVSAEGNFEGNNILNLSQSKRAALEDPLWPNVREKLMNHRIKRKAPRKDDKILTAWNGLMISALARAYQVTGEEEFLLEAKAAARFVLSRLRNGHELYRSFRDGKRRHLAMLDDYAFLIEGLLMLYESHFDPNWLVLAIQLQERQDGIFWDSKDGGFFLGRPDDETLVVNKKPLSDGVRPSGNSISALNLKNLYKLTFDSKYSERLEEVLKFASSEVERYPLSSSFMLGVIDYELYPSREIVVVSSNGSAPEAKKFIQGVWSEYLPSKVLVFGKPAPLESKILPVSLRGKQEIKGQVTFYVCENRVCKLPTTNAEKAFELIHSDSFK